MNIPVFAIIGARNEARDIENVLRQLGRAGIQGAVVVCNGGTDDTLARTLAFNAQSPFPVATVFFHAALGHDVARAVGTYALLRRVSAACKSAYCLYLDADLSGSFGPMLADFIAFGTAEDRDVTSLSSSCLRDEGMAGAAAIWREALHHQKAVPESAVPFMVPLLVHTRLFRRVSPSFSQIRAVGSPSSPASKRPAGARTTPGTIASWATVAAHPRTLVRCASASPWTVVPSIQFSGIANCRALQSRHVRRSQAAT
ncbi:hypothetical protein [Alicyclobacillus fastidiosus]|uniref:hypothetical protein n=1 Tax=Alicyclobacillus fastidiosus TaxID=392011 RepID=UPI0023E9DAB2|nr:hypothetical protein [Alicyclobacillus fastidiosus]GMA63985.1 hypothetical protein GCM10025859_44250 [Alicyclobacillus fastidiosus]